MKRKSFHSSNLIRVLSNLALVEAREPGGSFAEELGLWLNLDDAIALHALHTAGSTIPLSQFGSTDRIALNEEFVRLRSRLMKLDLPGGSNNSSSLQTDMPRQRGVPNDTPATYEPYRRCYLAHQRYMESSIRTFRVEVRKALAGTSPTLFKLAALDAIFDKSLCERERQLLSMLPSILAKRFEQLRQIHEQSLANVQDAENSALLMSPAVWLARFWQELQAVLLAELDARLEPTLGLIEVFNLEMSEHS